MAGTSERKVRKAHTTRKAFKVTKRKREAPSAKNHHFESFSQRIAKLNIDPIRRARKNYGDEDMLSTAFSYLKKSLEEWMDLNLSETFTTLSRKLQPLCESLPQVLHHQDQIMAILIGYISKEDAHSLEPILSLLSNFAHDLGWSFEKHFAQAVSKVTNLAANHPDVEVIEWSFSCLAWLFKFLSKLLVPDLRPVYDLMAPLLGTVQQKAFVTRFAAEAMSYLIRKAGAVSSRDPRPLRTIVAHIIQDVEKMQDATVLKLHKQGLMALFAEAIKGVQRSVHTGGPAIFEALMGEVFNMMADTSPTFAPSHAGEVLDGVLINLMHHTEAKTFGPILQKILDQLSKQKLEGNPKTLQWAAHMLYIVSGVRKGTRIQDWTPVLNRISTVIEITESSEVFADADVISSTIAAAAVALHASPLDALIPFSQTSLNRLSRRCWRPFFLTFCNVVNDLNPERFRSLLLPNLQRFIVAVRAEGSDHCSEDDRLSLLLPKLASRVCLGKGTLSSSKLWQDSVRSALDAILSDNGQVHPINKSHHLARCSAYLKVLKSTDPDNRLRLDILKDLTELLQRALKHGSNGLDSDIKRFALGVGFSALTKASPGTNSDTKDLWPSVCVAVRTEQPMTVFLETLLEVVRTSSNERDLQGPHIDEMIEGLVHNLAAPSHSLRLLSLEILDALYQARYSNESEILATALAIEQTSLSLETARTASMLVRKLGAGYSEASQDPWLRQAVPAYCFGLLHVRFAQIWDDACQALKVISECKEGEAVVMDLMFHKLRATEAHEEQPLTEDTYAENSSGFTDYQCSNLLHIDSIVRKSTAELADPADKLQRQFEIDHKLEQLFTTSDRSKALSVLNKIPQIAEKRSRLLVPMFLSSVAREDMDIDTAVEKEVDKTEPNSPAVNQTEAWSRKDQKAMLAIFAQFTNPAVLFRSQDVHQRLLMLLSNGDVEIQRAAFKAICAWKSPSVKPYEENLSNLLDDARFREEVSVFLSVGEDESLVQEVHRKELMPVLLRLLYGRVVARTGSASGRGGQEARRKAVFIALSRFGQDELGQFLQIALGPLDSVSLVGRDGKLNEVLMDQEILSSRKQFGLVRMLEDMLDTLASQLSPFASRLANAILYCLFRASRGLIVAPHDSTPDDIAGVQASLLRSIRQVGLRCLDRLFKACADFDWHGYMPAIFQELINPRIEKLPVETAQSVSGILQLLSTWSVSFQTVTFLSQYNQKALEKVSECLDVQSAKDEVKLFVLNNILKNVLKLTAAQEEDTSGKVEGQSQNVREVVVQPNAHYFLVRIGALLRKSPSKDLLEAGIQCVSQLAAVVTSLSEARNLTEISIFLLRQPARRVSPRTKSELLQILNSCLPSYRIDGSDALFKDVYETISSLFAYFKDRSSRQLLCQVFGYLSDTHPVLQEIADLCTAINSYSETRLDEPDFDRRMSAFTSINEEKYLALSPLAWQPLLYNMLYYIKDSEELAICTSSSFAIRRFVESASQASVTVADEIKELINLVILPAVYKGAREASEIVRVEYLAVLSHVVRHFPSWSPVADMEVLLVGNDEEASFFTNILHIQHHRRLRAMKRLASEAEHGTISSNNASHLFIPLMEHFIFDKATDENAHNLAAEAVRTVGTLAENLEWSQFRAMFRRFSSYLQSKPELEKSVIRLLSHVINALHRAGAMKGYIHSQPNELMMDGELESPQQSSRSVSVLSQTLPAQEKLSEDIQNNLLPPLTAYLHNKDESTVSLRTPVATAIVKVLQLLPSDRIADRLPPVLMDLCHILRSRAQESRDLTRKTLAEISVLVGPSYFGFVVRELRSALLRGYQLHVLSFTVHSILVSAIPTFCPGDLDYCLPEIVAIIMDDIFGVTGEEKESEEYVSKMKEVKSSKSFDSMELIAKVTTLPHLGDLIRPIQALLHERLNQKAVKKVDELLRRISLGVLHNPAVQDHQILVFCYEIIQHVYKSLSAPAVMSHEVDYKTKRYIINMKGAKGSESGGSSVSYIHKLIRFSLDVLRSVLHKHESLQTASKLAGFLPIIGDCLVQGQEEVQISTLRLLTTIIRVPLRQLDNDGTIYVSEAVRLVKAASSTNTEIAQAALKLIAAVLRDRQSIAVKENDLAYLLKRLKPDLEEPDRQGLTFNFLKSVLRRKILITEVYEVMDTVASIMITNHTRSARDLARSVYFQFLMEYPQGKDRFAEQLAFLVRNLDYKYVEGRQSVMEVINLLITKIGNELIQDVLATFFVPLVMVMANDESALCREMAGALVKSMFERADSGNLKNFTSLLKTWISQSEQELLTRVALQCWTLYFEAQGAKGKEAALVLQRVSTILRGRSKDRNMESWELLYYALQTCGKLCTISPETCFASSSTSVWNSVIARLSFPHAWVKLSAARLIGSYFAHMAAHNAEAGLGELPLSGPGGLQLTGEEMVKLTRLSLNILNVPAVSEELATQTVRNLAFLGRCFGANHLTWTAPTKSNEDAGQEDAAFHGFQDSEDEGEDDAADSTVTKPTQPRTALQYLFHRLSAVLRHEPATTRAESLTPKAASLQLLATFSNVLSVHILQPSLSRIILSLHRFTDPSIPVPSSLDSAFGTSYQSMVSTAQEVMNVLQNKLGTTEYLRILQEVRKGVKERREGRRVKRVLDRVSEPEKVGREKRRKLEAKKQRRKEKGMEARGRRRGW